MIYDDSYRIRARQGAHAARRQRRNDHRVRHHGRSARSKLRRRSTRTASRAAYSTCHTLRPLDEEAIIAAARETGVDRDGGGARGRERHVRDGRCAYWRRRYPAPMGCVGMKDRYAESGKWDEVLEKYGLTSDGIVKEVKATLARKSGGARTDSEMTTNGHSANGSPPRARPEPRSPYYLPRTRDCSSETTSA